MSDDLTGGDKARTEPPLDGDERATLVGFLEYQRDTLAWKCVGLTTEELSRTTAASTMTLGGLMKHMMYVEDHWFSKSLHGREPAKYWQAVDWGADVDWDWNSAREDSPADLFARWEAAVVYSRECLAEALAVGGLSHPSARVMSDGRRHSVRWILVHMIEEYARHNGHADLLREAVDGETGE